MNKGLKKLWQLGSGAAADLTDQIGVTTDQVIDDLKELRVGYKEKIDCLLKAWAEDDRAYELFEGFLEESDKGWRTTVAYLRKRSKEHEAYLAEQVRLTPRLVGSVDGFLQVYLAIPAERWWRSPRYRKGVKIGRVIGVVCAFTIFLPTSVGKAMISVLPGASRAARYLAKRWKEAKEKRMSGEYGQDGDAFRSAL